MSGKNLFEGILEAHVDFDGREKDVVLSGGLLEFLRLQRDPKSQIMI